MSKKLRYKLRSLRVGDIGWIIHRHRVLYAREYGWNEQFEALVGKILGEFVLDHDPKLERCWVASHGKEIIGCVFLVQQSKTVATAARAVRRTQSARPGNRHATG